MEIIHEVTLSQYAAKSAGGALKLGTRDSYGAEKIHVTRDETWAGLTITATFRIGSTAVCTPLDGQDRMDVPQEATSEAGRGTIVFVGTDGEQQIITKNLNYSVDDHDDAGGDAPNPTPDVWTQFVAQTKDNADRAELSADSANAAAAAAGQDADSAQRDARTAQQQAVAAAVLAGQVQQAAGQVQTDRTAVQAAAEQASRAAGQAAEAMKDIDTAVECAGRAEIAAQAAESAKLAAQEAMAAARQSQTAAKDAEDAAADSKSAAEKSASAAAGSAATAATDAGRAEAAAERAEAAAGFDPEDYATAEQGKKADTAVQPEDLPDALPNPEALSIRLNGGPATSYNGSVAKSVNITPAAVGAATAAQGAKADTAVQPEDLPDALPNPEALSIRLNGGPATSYDGSEIKSVNITPAAVGAATAAQGTKADTAMQPADGTHLYSATLLADGWTSAGSGRYAQTAALTPLTGGPAVTAGSVQMSDVMCNQTTVQETNETLQEVLGIINGGNTVLGANQVTVTVFEVPEADVEAIWQIKQGVS